MASAEYILKHGGSVTYHGYMLHCEHSAHFSTSDRAKWVFWGKSQLNEYDAVGPFDTLRQCKEAIDKS